MGKCLIKCLIQRLTKLQGQFLGQAVLGSNSDLSAISGTTLVKLFTHLNFSFLICRLRINNSSFTTTTNGATLEIFLFNILVKLPLSLFSQLS